MNVIRAAWRKVMGNGDDVESVPASDLMRFVFPGAQARWLGMDVAQYTPQRVAQVYSMAVAGDVQSQWEMFDLMESTWPELSKNLNELKDEVWLLFLQGDIEVKAFASKDKEPSEEAEQKAALVEEALWGMRPRVEADENDGEDTIRDLLDARGKGVSVLEVEWETRTGLSSVPGLAMVPRCTRWVHPQHYGWPGGSGQLMLKNVPDTAASIDRSHYSGFPPHKFIIGICKNKTGHPLGSAMLHVLTFWWAASNFTSDWFLNFAQVYGQPLRWATYDPAMSPADQTKLQSMLVNMGSSAWGMFPEGTAFELKEAAKGAGDNAHAAVLAVANKVCDLVILRQTLTSDVSQDGSGARALGEVHERKGNKVFLVAALWAGKVLQQLVRSMMMLNYGDEKECPLIGLKNDDGEDPKVLSEVLVNLSSAGFEVEDEELGELGDRLGVKVRRKAAAPVPLIGAGMTQMNAGRKEPGDDKAPGEEEEAPETPEAPDKVEARQGRKKDPSDEIAERRAKVLGAAYRGAMAPFRKAILESASAEDAIEKVQAAYADWSAERIAVEVEEALQLCAIEGTDKN